MNFFGLWQTSLDTSLVFRLDLKQNPRQLLLKVNGHLRKLVQLHHKVIISTIVFHHFIYIR